MLSTYGNEYIVWREPLRSRTMTSEEVMWHLLYSRAVNHIAHVRVIHEYELKKIIENIMFVTETEK